MYQAQLKDLVGCQGLFKFVDYDNSFKYLVIYLIFESFIKHSKDVDYHY